MPCISPVSAWMIFGESGERKLLFRPPPRGGAYFRLPCGKCIDCRLEYSRQWAIRGMHEASLYENNCFITLTFDDEILNVLSMFHSAGFEPEFDRFGNYFVPDRTRTLVKRDFVLFMKRLRKRFGPRIRYIHCGEYGSELGRPHHHACLFNFDFPDLEPFPNTSSSFSLKRSPILEELWPYGFSSVGRVTFESIAYVARYLTKKISGSVADDHYLGRVPEYLSVSRRPGLASGWISKYVDQVMVDDSVIVRGRKSSVPRYYTKYMDLTSPFQCAKLVEKRVERAESHDVDLNAHALILDQKFKQLKRSFEYGKS